MSLEGEVGAQVVAGVLGQVLVLAGRRIATALRGAGGRRDDDLAVARWFDTYLLTERPAPELDLPSDVPPEAVRAVLETNEVHALLHELLAARLTDAPQAQVDRLAELFTWAFREWVPAGGAGDVRAVADRLFGYFDDEICALAGRLGEREPALFDRIRHEAFLGRILAAIDRHATALTGRADPERDHDFVARYRRQVALHHGRLQPPDLQRRRLVPIDDLYVTPAVVPLPDHPLPPGADEPPTLVERRRPHAVLDLDDHDAAIQHAVLLGDPGAGKTTTAQVVMHRRVTGPATTVPFLVTVREFAADHPPPWSVVGYLEHRLETFYQCPAPPGLIERLLLDGSALVVFDGLDELVDTSRRLRVTEIVEAFCAEYPLAQVLVTARIVGYDEARLDDRLFTCFRIEGFDDERVGDYARRWFGCEDGLTATEAERVASAFLGESAEVADLRRNPLMLALMCILYRGEGYIPRSRPELYEQCAKLLFDKWDARRAIHVELRARHLVEPALRRLAHGLYTEGGGQAVVTEGELLRRAAAYFRERGFEDADLAVEAAREFVRFCTGRAWVFSDQGTSRDGERLYTFTHRTFLEYFTAQYLTSTHHSPAELARVLAPRIAAAEWDTVAQLAVQIKNRTAERGADEIARALLADASAPPRDQPYGSDAARCGRDPLTHTSPGAGARPVRPARDNILNFLARCTTFADLEPATVRPLTGEVWDRLLAELQAIDGVLRLRIYGPQRREETLDILLSNPGIEIRSTAVTVVAERLRGLLLRSREFGLRLGLEACAMTDADHDVSRPLHDVLRPRIPPALGVDEVAVPALNLGVIGIEDLARARADWLDLLVRPATGLITLVPPVALVALEQVTARTHSAAQRRRDLPSTRWFGRAPAEAILAAVDRLLSAGPEPPVVIRPEPFLAPDPGPQRHGARQLPDLPPTGFAAAFYLLAVLTEAEQRVSASAIHDLGLMGGSSLVRAETAVPGMVSYLMRRTGLLIGEELPPLPVEPRFQDWFTRWALGELDFTRPAPG